jgi:hypothetical protein
VWSKVYQNFCINKCVWIILLSQVRKINIYSVQKNIYVVAVYNGKPILFRINVDVTMCNLKHQLDELNGRLNYRDARRVASVQHCRLLIGSDRRIRFTNMKLQNEDNVRTMCSILSQYITNGLIKLDATLNRYVQDICSILIRLGTFDEIACAWSNPRTMKKN